MKKWMKYIIFSIIAILFCYSYAHVDKTHNIYDAETDSSAYSAVNLEKKSLVSQSFECSEENIDGVAAKIVVNSVTEDGKLTYLLKNNEGQEVIKGEVPICDIKSGRINKIKFDEGLDDCKGKTYTIIFGSLGLEEGESIGVYYDSLGKQMGELKNNEEKIEGTMILRTITHRFDMETFIVTLGFLFYFVGFFHILYKLFS